MSALAPKVAFYDAFLDSLFELPRPVQKKVKKFVRRFRRDPTDASIDYEKISTFDDPNLRTVRIDQTYRGIVLKPEQGDVYVMLWVDHHDKAHAWARHRRVSIHPDTGAIQVLAGTERTVPLEPSPSEESTVPPLFDALRDRELRRLGVPEDRLPALRALQHTEQLEAMAAELPEEAFEALWFLAEGESLEDVERAMAADRPAEVDLDDFSAALSRPDSQRRFVEVDDDDALAAMLDAPLDKWRVFLHPSQRRLAYRSWNGPVRVLGGAGTGKTVVGMHRAVWLARERFPHPDDRILFTTFTRNLATDIAAQLDTLAPPAVRERIEVTSLDAWASRVLRREGYDYTIAYFSSSKTLQELWDDALALKPIEAGLPEAFYRQEWEQVVAAQGCHTRKDYLRASRRGRGTPLHRGLRRQIWPVFEEYRALMERHRLREREGAFRDARTLLTTKGAGPHYRSIVVDEAQDMSTAAFELLRAAVPEGKDDLFLVGDGHQRIYARRVVLSHAGVHIVGRSHRLRINYRTTDEIRRFAVGLLEGAPIDDLDGGQDTTDGYRSLMHGDPPEVRTFERLDDELDAIAAWVQAGSRTPERTCLVTRTKAQRDRYVQGLHARGLSTLALSRRTSEDRDAPGLRVATMHRVKGLEFDHVVLAGLDTTSAPLQRALAHADDDATREDLETMERSLVYVALTRARKSVLVTAHGELSDWLTAP